MRFRSASVLALVLVTFGCSSEESRLREAKKIGAMAIDPRASLRAIEALTPVPPSIEYPRGKYGIENLVQAQWGKGLVGTAILELHFHASTHEVSATLVPFAVIARAPFLGTILGVRVGETAESALRKVRRDYPEAYVAPPSPWKGTRAGDTSEEWTIHLDDGHMLLYSKQHRIRRGKPVDPPRYNITLQYATSGYTIRTKQE